MKILRVSSCQVPCVVLGKERFRKKKVLSWNLFFGGVYLYSMLMGLIDVVVV